MSNTILSAKNTFQEGLIMDFSPDNTSAQSLTSALNATLITFNGNEMALQNDMGNGRVETAYLPEGFIPVGTCEFGDIIYIVSYNPLTNKSQIGCFPSPERNISTEEIGEPNQSLTWRDFQGGDYEPNGELVNTSVKKILYKSKDMSSGDKYIIYSNNINIEENNKFLSDYGNTSYQHNRFPKLVKIHVVSIEESGKIVFLDSTTKWYDNNFYISHLENTGENKIDLDSYRTMVSSAYSIFSSKVSGKLALLVELEKITGFSCTWVPKVESISNTDGIKKINYSIYWNINWTTENNNINPNGIVLTESKWTGQDEAHKGQYQQWIKVNEETNEWVLGGVNSQSWIDVGIPLPIAYSSSESNYYESNISRLYQPEFYTKTFDDFITKYSYEVKSKEILDSIKKNLGLTQDIFKVTLSDYNNSSNKYYVNCSQYIKDDKNIIHYYANDTSNNGELIELINPIEISDDIVNNTFNYPVSKYFSNFEIPIEQEIVRNIDNKSISEYKKLNINNLIYYYQVTPCMPYGLLREFSQDGYIDFSKIGTKNIKLHTWKYYNYENTSTLTWGMDAYTEPNKAISEVILEFYDNQKHPAAAYHIVGKNSYNGKFTEYLTLNSKGVSYKLNNKNAKGKIFYHKGVEITKNDALANVEYITDDYQPIYKEQMKDDNTIYYSNDAGTLYSNSLYLVKITIKYCRVGMLNEYIEDENSIITDYRWFWTNNMFNDYYYSVQDFKDLQFTLEYDCNARYEVDPTKYIMKTANYNSDIITDELITRDNIYKTLGATVQYINQDGNQNNNIKMAIQAGLVNDYNTFNLKQGALKNIKCDIYLANEYISNNPEQPSIKYTKEETTISEGIFPTLSSDLTGKVDSSTSDTLNKLVGSPTTGQGQEINESEDSYLLYKNNFHINVDPSTKSEVSSENKDSKLVYLNDQYEEVETSNFEQYSCTLDEIIYNESNKKIDKYFPLTFSGIHYSKYYYTNILMNNAYNDIVLRSFVVKSSDLQYYNLYNSSAFNKVLFKKAISLWTLDPGNRHARQGIDIFVFNGTVLESKDNSKFSVEDKAEFNVNTLVDYIKQNIINNFNFIFPVCFIKNDHLDKDGFNLTRSDTNELISGQWPAIVGNDYYPFAETGPILNGTLGYIRSDNDVEICDQYPKPIQFIGGSISKYQNILECYVPEILGILTQLFYIDDLSNTDNIEQIYNLNNIIYLNNNYTDYKRDVIIKLKTELTPEINSVNQLILLRGMDFQNYVNEILNQEEFKSISNDQVSIKASNVKLTINSCLKTSPIEFKVDYIKPELSEKVIQKSTLVKSIFSDFPKTTTDDFDSKQIYIYNYEKQKFENVRKAINLKKLSSFSIEDDNITSTYTSNNTNVNIVNIRNNFELDDGKLKISTSPKYNSTYTYDLVSSKNDEVKLTGFKPDLKLFT